MTAAKEKANKNYYLRNKDKKDFKDKRKNYYLKTKERSNNKSKEYRIKNKEKLREYYKKYREANKEKLSLAKRRHYLENKEHYINLRLEWHKNNPEKLAKYQRKLCSTNVNYKLAQRLRTRIWYALSGKPKKGSLVELIGITLDELKGHLESKFQEGMNWDNYGKNGWHVDHIRPCASYDLTDPEQQRQCFHYTNLQPLWAKDNLIKGAKILTGT